MVSLAAIETLAAGLWPGASHVAVTLPDPRKGEQIVLVTDKPDAERSALLAHAQAQGYSELWVPRAILVTAAIPVLGSGKVDYAGRRSSLARCGRCSEEPPPSRADSRRIASSLGSDDLRCGVRSPRQQVLPLARALRLRSQDERGGFGRPQRGSGMAAAFDEMHGLGGEIREAYQGLKQWLDTVPSDHIALRRSQAELFFRRIGITFAVYGDAEATERLIPFDIIPRVLTKPEWNRLEKGLVQRVTALNAFLGDVYGPRECLKAGIIPEDLVYRNPGFRPEMAGRKVPHDIYVHIAGIDIVRVDPDTFYVLEDNARTPSGVSYMLENREVMMRLFPELFAEHRVAPVENYPDSLLATLRSVAPRTASRDPVCVLLTPGQFNSAFYEHSFLADKLGIELVEGSDLFVRDDVVYMRTTQGPQRVDVIYRRIDDDFLDPLAFRPDSILACRG